MPRFHLLAIARLALSSKSLSRLCESHWAAGNEQPRAAQLLQQAVETIAHMGSNRPPQLGSAQQQQQQQEHTIKQQKQWWGAITWLLSTGDDTTLLSTLSSALPSTNRQLASSLAGVPGIPYTLVKTFVEAGLHLSCDDILAAARAGPLSDGVCTLLYLGRTTWLAKQRRRDMRLELLIYGMFMEPSASVVSLQVLLLPSHKVSVLSHTQQC